MRIVREYEGLELKIELSKDELAEAHREYEVREYQADVMSFISKKLEIEEESLRNDYDFDDEDMYEMASIFYEEKKTSLCSDTYAMAKAVIPYLEDRGVDFDRVLEDFEKCEDDL